MRLAEKKWTIREAADLAGFDKVNTLRSYFQRGHFRIIGGEKAQREGLAGLLTGHDVIALAVAERLIKMGAHPALAFDAGVDFAHFAEDGREPGRLFESGFTVLIFDPETGDSRVVQAERELSFNQLFFSLKFGRRNRQYVVLLNHELPRVLTEGLE